MSDTPKTLYMDFSSIPVGEDLPMRAYRHKWSDELIRFDHIPDELIARLQRFHLYAPSIEVEDLLAVLEVDA